MSEKTDTVPVSPQAENSDAERAMGSAAPKSGGASLIERWDAMERRNLPHSVKKAANPEPTPYVGEAPKSRTTPPAQTPADEALLQDIAGHGSESVAELKSQAAPASRPATTDTAAESDKAPRQGYTKVNYRVNYGSSSSGGLRRKQRNAEAAKAKKEAPETAAPAASAQQASATAGKANLEAPDLQDVVADGSPAESSGSPGPEAQAGGAADVTPAVDSGQSPQPADDRSGPQAATDEAANDGNTRGAVAAEAHDLTRAAHESHDMSKDTDDNAQTLEVRTTTSPPVPPIEDDMSYAHYGRSVFFGSLLLIFGIGGFFAWAALAPISSAVVAGGAIKIQGERKIIQHLEGGIIRELMVNEGDSVREGQVLIRLDGSKAEAVLEVQSAEYLSLLAKKSRLQAERNNLEEIQFAQPLLDKADDPDVAELLEAERSLFADRKANIDDQLRIFESWVEGYKREIAGLKAQKVASEKQLFHINDELKSVETLYKKGVVAKTRLLELKRTAAGLVGQTGSLTADIARAEQKIGEAELRGVSLQTERAESISNELSQVENSIRRIKEQLPAQHDVVDRLEIRSPRSGRVVNLHYHTAGGVISPSTPIMDIVPEDEVLIVEARVQPIDIDALKPGMPAQITLTAYSQRKTPPVAGRLQQVSADRLDDPKTGESYYQAFVEIDKAALAELTDVSLYPGMPVSVQFISGERTPLDYLLSPIEAGLRNSWLEE
ncbi:MAG: HlyD family type I secretion periplasmic adaptor subunit [Sedimenticolaceae bacterium]